ncbi:restriction endonuclease [Bauldia litoralis]|uniref:restriction endonuclease n=1 Tax=Bauldia litoralis TaxID=665467 RepID=UPI003264DB4D
MLAKFPSIAPATVRYIKLGEKGCWENASLDRAELHFGENEGEAVHAMGRRGDRAGIVAELVRRGRAQGSAADAARQIVDFYQLGADCLWITFARGRMWWAFAEPEVISLETASRDHGDCKRQVIGIWRDTDLLGEPLRMDLLSSKLTQLAAYRNTICSVAEEAYCLRRINVLPEPIVEEAKAARAALQTVTAKLISALHWRDFELMVDLIFARSGWQRISEVGGDQKDTDLKLVLPTTGERAFVQVKSTASQAVLDQSIARFQANGGFQHMFFVCHSPSVSLSTPPLPHVHVWSGSSVAQAAVTAGLFDWLVDRAR